MTILSGVKLKLYPNKTQKQTKPLNKLLETVVLFGINFVACKKIVMMQ